MAFVVSYLSSARIPSLSLKLLGYLRGEVAKSRLYDEDLTIGFRTFMRQAWTVNAVVGLLIENRWQFDCTYPPNRTEARTTNA